METPMMSHHAINAKAKSDPEPCEHKWAFLRKSDTYETGYRKWAHDDTYFCEKCLKYKSVTVDHEERPRYGW